MMVNMICWECGTPCSTMATDGEGFWVACGNCLLNAARLLPERMQQVLATDGPVTRDDLAFAHQWCADNLTQTH